MIQILSPYLNKLDLLDRLRASPFAFGRANPVKLRLVLDILKGCLDASDLRRMLSNDLLGIVKADPGRLKKIIAIIESRIGPEGLRERLAADMQSFAAAHPERLLDTFAVVAQQIGVDGLNKRLRTELLQIALARPSHLKKIIQILNARFEPQVVSHLMLSSLRGFVEGQEDELPAVLDFFIKVMGKPWLRKRLVNQGFYPFAKLKISNLESYYGKLLAKQNLASGQLRLPIDFKDILDSAQRKIAGRQIPR